MGNQRSVIIAGRSALDIWGHLDPCGRNAPEKTSREVLSRAHASAGLIEDLAVHSYLPTKRKLVVLVGSQNRRMRTEGIECRWCAASIPRGSFYQIGPQVYVASPELALVQEASSLSTARIAEETMRLCGNYFINPTSGRIDYRARAATTLRRLLTYMERAKGITGIKNLRQALPWVLEGAESPMEVKTALLLSLPYRMGGYGCPAPELNPEIDPKSAAHLVNQSTFRVDICWRTKGTIVEYDGKEFHLDAHRDKRRANDLEGLGWKVFMLTSSEIYNEERFDKFARKVARSIGHRVCPPSSWALKRAVLRSDLDLGMWGPSDTQGDYAPLASEESTALAPHHW